jgi:LPXTG-site transpeptidase (sortase) family protein
MHYYVDQPRLKPATHHRVLGFICLATFVALLWQVWVPYTMAAVNATLITVLPPEWADSYIAATLPKTANAATSDTLIIDTKDLHIEAPIVQGSSPADLLKGVGHDISSSVPGAQGRVVISGHRFWPDRSPWAQVFFSLDKLKVGDTITLIYGSKTYKYKVFEKWDVPAAQAVPKLAPTTEPILTIYTCGPTPYSSKNRLGFNAMLDESEIKNNTSAVIDTLHEGVLP